MTLTRVGKEGCSRLLTSGEITVWDHEIFMIWFTFTSDWHHTKPYAGSKDSYQCRIVTKSLLIDWVDEKGWVGRVWEYSERCGVERFGPMVLYGLWVLGCSYAFWLLAEGQQEYRISSQPVLGEWLWQESIKRAARGYCPDGRLWENQWFILTLTFLTPITSAGLF